MPQFVVLLSGSVASGKSTLANHLVQDFEATLVKTWQLLTAIQPDVARDRGSLQALGEKLDRDTGGRWVSEALGKKATELPKDALIVVDSVRILSQIDWIRRGFGPSVIHVHLEASDKDLRKRYAGRKRKDIQELATYDEVLENETEKAVPQLRDKADIVINSTWSDERDVLIRAASRLGLYGRGATKLSTYLSAANTAAKARAR